MKFELKPYNRDLTDNELLEDLIKVAKALNKQTLSCKEYTNSRQNRVHSATIALRFGGWNNALEKAGLNIISHHNITDKELLEDLKRVTNETAPIKVTQNIYSEKGKYGTRTIQTRFGWNNALNMIGSELSFKKNITEIELFKNLEEVWIKLGHQPGRREMIKPYSNYSESPYITKYGSWRKTLEAFVDYINSDNEEIKEIEEIENNITDLRQDILKHSTKRDISDRLKVKVLIRDGNKCRLCGITVTGDNIHFDHIKPWSKGGETILENIQVLCAPHNLAKGNYDIEEN